jgi:Uncharacterized protein conserved in bacteria
MGSACNRACFCVARGAAFTAEPEKWRRPALAVCSPERSVYFPDMPTTAEGGYPGVQLSNHCLLLLPA